MAKRKVVPNGHRDDGNASDVSEVSVQSSPIPEPALESDDNVKPETETVQSSMGPPSKKLKKQITAQEIQVARETAELFKSNIFKLQIEELINEVKLKERHVTKIEMVLHKLHDLIKEIPEIENVSLETAESRYLSKKIVIPFPDPKPTKLNYTFSYLNPQDVSLVGSFGLKTGTYQSNSMSIDMVLMMSPRLFQPKDFLNYRCLYKRAFYLAYLTEHLITSTKRANLPIKILYKYLNDDVLCPVLQLDSISTDNPQDLSFHKTKFSINLIVGFPFAIFDVKKLLPHKNCIRIQSDLSELPPTPLYNASILSLTAYSHYLKYLYTAKKSAEGFKDACVLGNIWLSQRGFGSSTSKGGFGHFEFAMLISILLHGGGTNSNRILLHGFSSYQLFKGVVKYLATMDLASGYLSFSSDIGSNITSKFNANEGFNVPTIFDKTVKLNILWKMTNSSYNYLKRLASETLVLLNDVVKDRFENILLQNAKLSHLQFDLVLNLSVPNDIHHQYGAAEKITFITFENFVMNKVYVILKKALGDRVFNIIIQKNNHSNTFAINKRKLILPNDDYTIGLILNPDECEKLVTKGPSNSDEEASIKFKKFWGSKSSLRRFKDGSIQHCVIWKQKPSEPVVVSIINSSLDTHFCPDTKVTTETASFNKFLPIPLLPSGLSQSITAVNSFTTLKSSFDTLSKVLSNLTLSLNVKSVSAASPGLRYTTMLQPVPFAMGNPDFWNDVVLQFESSARWPDELESLEKTKTAFLLKILDALNKESIYRSFVTQDTSIPFLNHVTLLNILTPDGFGFRIRIFTERDEILYQRAIANAPEKQKGRVQDIYLKFIQKYIGVTKHTRTITTLAHHYPFYSPTVRLFKRWLDSHLLLTQFNEELVELIALKPFVDPAPYSVPHSVQNGFLKILAFLAQWHWKDHALVLDLVKHFETKQSQDILVDELNVRNLSDALTVQTSQIIESNFEKIRKSDPSGIKTQLFIGTKDDPSGILWSNELTLPIASRLTMLAKASFDLIRKNGVTAKTVDSTFSPILKDYDFVIDLQWNYLMLAAGILPSNSFKNLMDHSQTFPKDVTANYDVTLAFVDDLNRKFGHVIIFSSRKFGFLDKDGSNIAAGLFIPGTLSKKKFKVNFGIHVQPVTDDEVIINKESILHQITLLGGDLIKDMALN